MRRYYAVSGILLILPIIDFALAAPVLVPEKRQKGTGVNVVHTEDATTMLGKRGDELNELWLKLFGDSEDHFAKPEESSAARPSSSSPPSGPADGWTDITQPLPSIPEEPSPVSSPDRDHTPPQPGSLTESGYESMDWDALPGPWGPASSTANHGLVGAHALPNPGPSTEPDHEMMDVSPPPGSASRIESDHEMMDVSPSPMETDDHEMVDVPPSNSVFVDNPNRGSMGAGSSSGKRKKNLRLLMLT
jgi:hypothetical protein